MTLFLVLITALIGIAAAASQEILTATQEMQRANYFTFVMLIKMAPEDAFGGNITFLMPNDKALATAAMAGKPVLDFLLRHSIPSPLLIDHLEHFPSGSMIPTAKPGFVFKVTNGGRRRFFLSNVKIISPNICTRGTITCHGIDGVVEPAMVPQPDIQPTPPCAAPVAPSPTTEDGPHQAPPLIAASSPSALKGGLQKSSSYRSVVVDLLTVCFMLALTV